MLLWRCLIASSNKTPWFVFPLPTPHFLAILSPTSLMGAVTDRVNHHQSELNVELLFDFRAKRFDLIPLCRIHYVSKIA